MFSAAPGMLLMRASTAAEAKASKAAVHYRDYPSEMRMCHMCKFYIAGGGGRSGMGCMGGRIHKPGPQGIRNFGVGFKVLPSELVLITHDYGSAATNYKCVAFFEVPEDGIMVG